MPRLSVDNPLRDLTPDAFGKLLLSFDPDWNRAGEKYEQVRRGLVYFFQCRGGTFPEDHADETLNRVACKLARGEEIRDPYTFVYGVARMILLEVFKQREKERLALVNAFESERPAAEVRETEEHESKMECLRHCLEKLPPETRNFITRYYQGLKRSKIENRRLLASQLQIPLNALRLRARRIREKLETCMDQCLRKQETKRNVFERSDRTH